MFKTIWSKLIGQILFDLKQIGLKTIWSKTKSVKYWKRSMLGEMVNLQRVNLPSHDTRRNGQPPKSQLTKKSTDQKVN
jgi:hypothetical protein